MMPLSYLEDATQPTCAILAEELNILLNIASAPLLNSYHKRA